MKEDFEKWLEVILVGAPLNLKLVIIQGLALALMPSDRAQIAKKRLEDQRWHFTRGKEVLWIPTSSHASDSYVVITVMYGLGKIVHTRSGVCMPWVCRFSKPNKMSNILRTEIRQQTGPSFLAHFYSRFVKGNFATKLNLPSHHCYETERAEEQSWIVGFKCGFFSISLKGHRWKLPEAFGRGLVASSKSDWIVPRSGWELLIEKTDKRRKSLQNSVPHSRRVAMREKYKKRS